MSEEAAPQAPSDGGKIKVDFLIVVLNMVVSLAAVGMLTYTKLIFKRPPITESKERARLEKMHEKKKGLETETALVTFDPITINLKPNPALMRPVDVTGQIDGKLHYATIGFAIEIKDASLKGGVEDIKPLLQDKLLSIVARKQPTELTTVQGRFLLRSQIMDAINDLLQKPKPEPSNKEKKEADDTQDDSQLSEEAKEVFVTNVYFTNFVVM